MNKYQIKIFEIKIFLNDIKKFDNLSFDILYMNTIKKLRIDIQNVHIV